ncbi:MAG: DegT/DnrJ/EryC1/StrS family aminotransferase [Proteobacteria bacterium]|nr:DegT/DnrJ/EryC1/StrS family aminotransferase [Pseudomonadota bacterium]
MKIPLIKPYITQEIKDKVCEVLDSGYLTEGPVTKEFEEAFKDYIGCQHAIAVTSCTTGLEIALRVLKIGPGDEVVVPDYTYPATADVVAIVDANIVIVDVCRDTMLIDYDALEQAITPRTKAIIPVSIFGNPLDYDRLNAIKEKYGVRIIEDAACSIGGEFRGTKAGNLADVSVFSLHPRKFITTGEGGMITTNNTEWAAWMDSYKHFGMGESPTREGTVFARIGTNYKLSNILAAVGLVQMRHINELLAKRIELSENYILLLKDVSGINIPATTPYGKNSRQSFCVYVPDRDGIIKQMREEGIEAQIGTYAIHMHPAFAEGPQIIHHGSFTDSRYAYDHCLALPLYHGLMYSEQEYIIDNLKRCLTIH